MPTTFEAKGYAVNAPVPAVFDWYIENTPEWTWENDNDEARPLQVKKDRGGVLRFHNGEYGLLAGAMATDRLPGNVLILAHGPWKPLNWDLGGRGVPEFWTEPFLDLDRVTHVSRFRSRAGRSYTGDFESCRSMKTHFARATDSATVTNHSPVEGRILAQVAPLGGGGQDWHIEPEGSPGFRVILFNTVVDNGHEVGDEVSAGEALGPMADPDDTGEAGEVALRVRMREGYTFVPVVHAMTDEVWSRYAERGVESREALVVTKESRDADSYACEGERFQNGPSGEDYPSESWVALE
jgi:hypothetical protein